MRVGFPGDHRQNASSVQKSLPIDDRVDYFIVADRPAKQLTAPRAPDKYRRLFHIFVNSTQGFTTSYTNDFHAIISGLCQDLQLRCHLFRPAQLLKNQQ
jgi:hypothetical protein